MSIDITDEESERRDFEACFSKSPFEWEFNRHAQGTFPTPGWYVPYHIQCAWEGWLARASLHTSTEEKANNA